MTGTSNGPGLVLEVPGDKSVTHRALLFGALCRGTMVVQRPLIAADTQATARVLRHCGVEIPELTPAGVTFAGVGLQGLKAPTAALDCGNSGTTARLLLGVLAGQNLSASVTGDESLRSRPMRRVTQPLSKMGARFHWEAEEGFLPLRVDGGELQAIDLETGVASAQVKSAILLGALTRRVFALVTEPEASRDHTERLLAAMGAGTVSHRVQGGWRVELRDPPEAIHGVEVTVPGDFSTAAFPLVWGLCRTSGPDLVLPRVGLNPTRTGLLDVLVRMGADIEVLPGDETAEPTGTLIARPSKLTGTLVEAAEIPRLVDEIPALAVAALFAEGETVITGAQELRVKESDRIDALARNLDRIGAEVEEAPDGLTIRGPLPTPRGAVESFHDHRVEMAFGVLEALTRGQVSVETRGAADVSYPAFWSELQRLEAENANDVLPKGAEPQRPPVVTIDGPAGSGKSTTARAVAQRLGLVHLDSGALYRGIAHALLSAKIPQDGWDALREADVRDLGLEAEIRHGSVHLSLHGEPVADAALRSDGVTAAVSRVAALASVRSALIQVQRDAAAEGGLVADGRDMGTVVFPDAEVKVFLVADLEERARRRVEEGGAPDGTSEEAVAVMAQRLQARDFEDSHREHSPLRRPADAVVIDTTSLTPDQQVQTVLDEVRAVWSPER